MRNLLGGRTNKPTAPPAKPLTRSRSVSDTRTSDQRLFLHTELGPNGRPRLVATSSNTDHRTSTPYQRDNVPQDNTRTSNNPNEAMQELSQLDGDNSVPPNHNSASQDLYSNPTAGGSGLQNPTAPAMSTADLYTVLGRVNAAITQHESTRTTTQDEDEDPPAYDETYDHARIYEIKLAISQGKKTRLRLLEHLNNLDSNLNEDSNRQVHMLEAHLKEITTSIKTANTELKTLGHTVSFDWKEFLDQHNRQRLMLNPRDNQQTNGADGEDHDGRARQTHQDQRRRQHRSPSPSPHRRRHRSPSDQDRRQSSDRRRNRRSPSDDRRRNRRSPSEHQRRRPRSPSGRRRRSPTTSPARRRRSRSRDSGSLPVFNGKSSLEGWMQMIELAADDCDWSDRTICRKALRQLTDKAADWLTNQMDRGTAFRKWDGHSGLKEALTYRFGSNPGRFSRMSAWQTLRQTENESVVDFFDRCERAIAIRDKHSYRKKWQSDEDLCNVYMAGLKSSIERELRYYQAQIETPSQLLELAREAERSARPKQQAQTHPNPNKGKSGKNQQRKNGNGNGRKHVNAQANAYNACRACTPSDHDWADCSKNPNKRATASDTPVNSVEINQDKSNISPLHFH